MDDLEMWKRNKLLLWQIWFIRKQERMGCIGSLRLLLLHVFICRHFIVCLSDYMWSDVLLSSFLRSLSFLALISLLFLVISTIWSDVVRFPVSCLWGSLFPYILNHSSHGPSDSLSMKLRTSKQCLTFFLKSCIGSRSICGNRLALFFPFSLTW